MLPSYTTFLIDLDGVIYRGEELLPGAQQFVTWLNATHKNYLFLTNNSFASESQVVAKLARLGIHTDSSHVLGAGQAAVKIMARRFPHGIVYVVGEQPLRDMVEAHGLHVATVDTPTDSINVVFVGLDRAFDYQKMTKAVAALRAGATFIAINRDPLLPIEGALVPGCGAMVAAIEASSGVHPEVIGKPQPTLLYEAMKMLASTAEETVMIGDGLDTDIAGGRAAGTHTLFVLSGKDTRTDLATTPFLPELVYENLATMVADLPPPQETEQLTSS